MNKEELIIKALDFILETHKELEAEEVDEMYPIDMAEFAQQYADAQTIELKAEIESLKSKNADFKQCLVFTITCNSGADFEEMKHKAKKLLKLV